MKLREGVQAYAAWGASAKAERLEDDHADLLEDGAEPAGTRQSGPSTLSLSRASAFLDAEAVLKAADAISAEIRLDGLLDRLLRILMENAGADRGVLLLRQGDDFRVEAEIEIDHETGKETLALLASAPVARSGALPLSVFNRVVRTRSPMLVRDARFDPATAVDPYVASRGSRSILAVPLVNQGEVISVAYLENTLNPHAFTSRTTEFVRLISGQASTSLRNAGLYEGQVALARSAQRFVPHAFLDLMGRKRLEDVRLGEGVQREMTVMFTDIRGFTSLSESLTPREVFEYVNGFLQEIGPEIRGRRGFVGKYLGDGAMAFFPEAGEDAVDAALGMLARLARRETGAPGERPLRIGIGLHHGSVLLGVMGEAERLQCDAISDAANVASRLETLAGAYGLGCVASEDLARTLPPIQQDRLRPLGLSALIGRREPIRAFELVPDDGTPLSQGKLATRSLIADGLEHFEARRFVEAARRFAEASEACPQDPVARLFHRNAERFEAAPPPSEWIGAVADPMELRERD